MSVGKKGQNQQKTIAKTTIRKQKLQRVSIPTFIKQTIKKDNLNVKSIIISEYFFLMNNLVKL